MLEQPSPQATALCRKEDAALVAAQGLVASAIDRVVSLAAPRPARFPQAARVPQAARDALVQP